MSEWQGSIELELNEARYLRHLLAGDLKLSDERRARSLVIKLIDAVFTLERPHSPSTYIMAVDEPDIWFLDAVVNEFSKDWAGKSLQPLARKVWALLHGLPMYSSSFLGVPEMGPATDEGDLTYRAAQARQKEADSA